MTDNPQGVKMAVAKPLTPRQLQCWNMTHDRGMTPVMIGKELGINEVVVRQHLKYAAKKLEFANPPKLKAPKAVERALTAVSRVVDEMEDMSDKNVIKLMTQARHKALCLFDENILAMESAQGLARVVGVLTDKIQLLKGEPTQITRIEDIRKLDEVANLLHRECQRRGVIIDGAVN